MNAAAKEVAKLTNGAVDYLIINGAYMGNDTAALSPTQVTGIEKLFQEEMEKMFLTNTIGPVYAINAFLPLIRTGKVKKITVISSGMADPDFILTAGVAPAIAYSASKAAVNIIVSKFAVELKPDSITLLALSPGLVDTRGPEGEPTTRR
jgi:NAD(P)-dependent dehydrogenase (short-subunit alcohol dehydrogenase family)